MITIFIIIVVFSIGFIDSRRINNKTIEDAIFFKEYYDNFNKLHTKYFKGQNCNKDYTWLTLNLSRIENLIRTLGIVSYRPPSQNYVIKNYQILTNTLQQFRQGCVQINDANLVNDCLVMCIGYLDEYKKVTSRNIINPLVWFRDGFRKIINIPFIILTMFGLFNRKTVDNITRSLIYKVLTGLVGLVTLVGGLVTIVLGYDQSIKIIKATITSFNSN